MNKTLFIALVLLPTLSGNGWGGVGEVPEAGPVGIASNTLVRGVTVRVEPGQINGGSVFEGRIIGEAVYTQWPSAPGLREDVTARAYLRIYQIDFVSDSSSPTVELSETLIYNTQMGRLSIFPGASTSGQLVTETFVVNANNVSNQQGSLLRHGVMYRAEVVIERGYSDVRVTPGFEAGAADMLFWMHSFWAPLSSVSGQVTITATHTANKGATAQQRRNLITRETQEFAKAGRAIADLLARHGAASGVGELPKAGWTWKGGSVQQIWPPRNNTAYLVSAGEVYTSTKAAVAGAFSSVARGLTKTYQIPGGAVSVKVVNGLKFTDTQ